MNDSLMCLDINKPLFPALENIRKLRTFPHIKICSTIIAHGLILDWDEEVSLCHVCVTLASLKNCTCTVRPRDHKEMHKKKRKKFNVP